MSSAQELRVGILGLGFMGRTHLAAWNAARAEGLGVRITALCDREPERAFDDAGARGNIEAEAESPFAALERDQVHLFQKPEALFADPEVDAISLCTPTDTHVPLARAALEEGKHVLLEKPVSLSADEAQLLAESAADARGGALCMPAMCMRFWPGWSWLRERVKGGDFGQVRSAVFRRLASRPGWSEFYSDTKRTGGALFDLHVHDADFVRWCFGAPQAVTCAGTRDHLTALYHYESGPASVVAEGGWDHDPGHPFRMHFTVVFERATCDFELGRDPVLRLAQGGESQAVELPAGSGYDGEVRHFLAAVRGEVPLAATTQEAAALTAQLEAEVASLERGERVLLSPAP